MEIQSCHAAERCKLNPKLTVYLNKQSETAETGL